MMNLHNDKQNFKDLIEIASNESGISQDIIEKDYYVTLMLQELAQNQSETKAYFKGGTCLYKIYFPMKRFSEDIDLTVCVKNISNSKAKSNLKKVSEKYTCLDKDYNNPKNENKKGSITQVYSYESMFDVPNDSLQRYEKVQVEATSFTISEPIETNKIHALLIDLLPQNIVEKVKAEYEMSSFLIKNITLERIFCDKLLAAEFYAERNESFDVAKHIYDIVNMLNEPRIQKMLNNQDLFIQNLSYKRIEETLRIGSDLWNKPFCDFKLKDYISSLNFTTSFIDMQNKYVFSEKYKIPINEIQLKLNKLYDILLSIDNKEQMILKSNSFIIVYAN